MTSHESSHSNSLVFRLARSGLASAVLWTGLTLSAITFFLAFDRAQLSGALRFQETADEIRAHIDSRLQMYITALRQARGLFHLRNEADRDSFRVLTETIHPSGEYPGLIGLGYVEPVLTDGHENLAVRFFEPEKFETEMKIPSGTNAISSIIDGNPSVLEALREARDSGRPALTRKIAPALAPASDAEKKSVFILALPVYKSSLPHESVESRRQDLKGFVFTVFDSQQFFEGPVSKTWLAGRHVHFAVYEEKSAADLPSSDQPPLYEHAAQRVASLKIPFKTVLAVSPASHPLWLRIESTPGFIATLDYSLPWILLGLGGGLSFLLFHVLRTHAYQASRLLKSERQLQLVTDALPVLISYVDKEQTFQFNNQAYEKWFHTPLKSLQGRSVRSLFSARSYENVQPFIELALRGETLSFETEIHLAEKAACPVHAEFIPDFASDGSVKGFVALYSDVSERRQQEERSRFLVELSAILGASLEVEATLARLATLLSPAIADWCMIESSDEAGSRRVIVHSHDPARRSLLKSLETKFCARDTSEPSITQSPAIDSFLAAGPDQARDVEILSNVGAASVMVVPLKARNHHLGTLTLVSASVEKHFNEADLLFAKDIGRRAALAIDNARLYREASHANRAKDEFLATLSHELRTPMNVILGWLELLSTDTFDEETFTQALATLSRNAGLQLQLINDLLDVSKIVNGKITLNVEKADLGQLIESAVDGFKPAARAKNISLDVDIFATEACVFGDANRIHQILWNLLSNALKFTPDGGRVGVKLEAADQSLRITVEDSGRGIDPRFLPFLFDRFRQEETGSNRSQGGLGLGLSIVRYLVELHGGQIEACSRGRDQGAAFIVTFPQRHGALSIIPVYKQAAPETAAPDDSLQGLSVLVVDDSPDVRALVGRILKRAGCEVLLAEDAKSAWQILESTPPHVIVSDLGLPVEDGLSLMTRWREHEAQTGSSRIPAAAMTGFVQPNDERRTFTAGYDLHVAKPVTNAELLAALRDLCKLRRRGEGPRAEDLSSI